MSYVVHVAEVAARPTIVVATTTTWQQFPGLWKEMLDEVWACLKAGGISSGCRNVMVYFDDLPTVEVGVESAEPCALSGRVAASALPAGRVATTVHRGSYSGLRAAHQAVLDWCAAHGERPSGTRWEVYGPHHDDAAQIWTEISWLLV